jgi:DNA-binding LacI/PurR family transcriptional regulator
MPLGYARPVGFVKRFTLFAADPSLKCDQEGAVAATMADVARAANVSRSLVSLVFQDSPKVSPRSRRKVLKAAEKLGYRPNALARRLASGRSNTVGVLINDLHNQFFAELYDGVADGAAAHGCQLLLATGNRSANLEIHAVETFLQQQVEALVLLSPRIETADIATLTAGIPSVVVGRDPQVPGVDVVTNDEDAGSALAVRHLIELGHRRISHVSGGPSGAGASARELGYRAAMRAAGLAREIDVVIGDFTEEAGVQAAR